MAKESGLPSRLRWRRLPVVTRATYERVLAELEDADLRIERAWEKCLWASSTKAEIAATLLPGVSGDDD